MGSRRAKPESCALQAEIPSFTIHNPIDPNCYLWKLGEGGVLPYGLVTGSVNYMHIFKRDIILETPPPQSVSVPYLLCFLPLGFVKYEQQQLLEMSATSSVTYGRSDTLKLAPAMTFQIPDSPLLYTTSCSFRGALKMANRYMKSQEQRHLPVSGKVMRNIFVFQAQLHNIYVLYYQIK